MAKILLDRFWTYSDLKADAEAKNCPFCGYDSLRVLAEMSIDGETPAYYVQCQRCGAEGPHAVGTISISKQEAVDRWNWRTAE